MQSSFVESDDLRLISPRETRALTSVSEREQKRRPDFPKPVRLGTGSNGRIGFVLGEVRAWNAAQIAKRDQALPAPPTAAELAAVAVERPAPQAAASPAPRRRGRPRSAAPRDTAPAARAAAPPPSGE